MENIDLEEDVVVEEIPVFLSKNLLKQLFLFQFPTKKNTNFDAANVVNCFVEPVKKQVKMEFELDTKLQSYEENADGQKPAKSNRLRQAYSSTLVLNGGGRFLVGIFASNEFHLTPLTSVLNLRPSFSHFDNEDKRIKAGKQALNKKDLEAKLVTVKFANSKKTKTEVKKINSSDETWYVAKWHQRTSPAAELEIQKLYATNK